MPKENATGKDALLPADLESPSVKNTFTDALHENLR